MGKNLFNSIKLTKPKNNVFDLTHDVKLSLNMGELVPIMCTECVPGDKFNISAESMIRFAPLVSPVMHRIDVSIHYFFVPNRIIWPNWEKFITQTKVGDPPALPAFPTLTYSEADWWYLHDYLGLPKPIGVNEEVISALPFAVYQKIYNDYYRDQNLMSEIPFELLDGSNEGNPELWQLRNRCWEHDYFTAALPFAQKGDAVDIPLGDVRLKDDWNTGRDPGENPSFLDENEVKQPGDLSQDLLGDINATFGGNPPQGPLAYDPAGTLETEGTTINDLRRAFRLQEWLEKNARAGTRYVENILAHFGVRSSDKRLQRAEYITGVKTPVQISEVLNTTGTEDLPQGNMAGHAIAVTSGKGGSYFCEEHGYIMGIMSVMPKTAYQQGIPKHFLKTSDPFQYYWPSFAHIGEQEVLKKEIYAFQGAAGNNTFGYVPRYAEYKFEHNRVAGEFRTTLDFWHLGRIFSAPPALGASFVEVNPESTTRIFAVEGTEETQHLYAHVLNKIRAVRPMPKFGTPSF